MHWLSGLLGEYRIGNSFLKSFVLFGLDLLLVLPRMRNVRWDKGIKADIVRNNGETAHFVARSPYRGLFPNEVRHAARYIRRGTCWGGYV